VDNSDIGSGYLNWVVMINEHQYNAAVAGV